jgi:hypothetical protein
VDPGHCPALPRAGLAHLLGIFREELLTCESAAPSKNAEEDGTSIWTGQWYSSNSLNQFQAQTAKRRINKIIYFMQEQIPKVFSGTSRPGARL